MSSVLITCPTSIPLQKNLVQLDEISDSFEIPIPLHHLANPLSEKESIADDTSAFLLHDSNQKVRNGTSPF
jgi:hypothetical protein